MANPQQPELRRSERVPALDPDASEAELSGRRRPETTDRSGEIPEEQRPGHRPDDEEDKPDLDAFAERLGVAPEGAEPADAPRVETDGAGGQRWQSQWPRLGVPVAVGVMTVAVLRRRRRGR